MYPFLVVKGLYGDPTLGSRADDPMVEEKPRRRRALRMLALLTLRLSG